MKGFSKALTDAVFTVVILALFTLCLNGFTDDVWRITGDQVSYIIGLFVGLFIGFREREKVRHD